MEKDTEIIYECILEKTYTNIGTLQTVLSSVQDKRLAIGFAFDLAMRHSAYGIERDGLMELLAQTMGGMKAEKYITDCHEFFINTIKTKNSQMLERNRFFERAITFLLSKDEESFDRLAREDADNGKLAELKQMLLDDELYEYIASVDKHIKEI